MAIQIEGTFPNAVCMNMQGRGPERKELLLNLARVMWLTSWSGELKNCPSLMGRGKAEGVKGAAATTCGAKSGAPRPGRSVVAATKVLNVPLGGACNGGEKRREKPPEKSHVVPWQTRGWKCDCFLEGQLEPTVRIVGDETPPLRTGRRALL
jgi:hypothetical protein